VDWRKGCWAAAATFVILHVMAIVMFEFSFLTPAHLVLMGTAYILGSRAWRSVTRKDTARA